MATDNALKQMENEVAKAIDDTVESLKWCKRHRHERKALDTMRLVQLNLGYLAMAMDWEMEGDLTKARDAMGRFWWQPFKEQQEAEWIGWGH
jgi:hypothetical protein